jgi:pimeloyl-ACP methyl ester carboxylesterase
MQRRHPIRHLLWRGGVAAVSQALMFSGLYPLLPHALRALDERKAPRPPSEDPDRSGRSALTPVRVALAEWGMAAALSAVRPAGFLPLPGARATGPRPIIVLHGYAMNRANFVPLAYRLRRAGLGPIVGFEYWTLGRVAAGARQLGWFIDEVRERTGAAQVDVIGHSMGGVVGRYYVSLAGGDGIVRHLITLGSPLAGTEFGKLGVGHPARELLLGSKLCTRLAAAAAPRHTRTTAIWSRSDALVPGARQPPPAGAEILLYDDLGHVALLGSRRVAAAIAERLLAG